MEVPSEKEFVRARTTTIVHVKKICKEASNAETILVRCFGNVQGSRVPGGYRSLSVGSICVRCSTALPNFFLCEKPRREDERIKEGKLDVSIAGNHLQGVYTIFGGW